MRKIKEIQLTPEFDVIEREYFELPCHARSLNATANLMVGFPQRIYESERSELSKRVHNELIKYYAHDSMMRIEELQEPLARQIASHMARQPNMQTNISVTNPDRYFKIMGECDLAIINGKTCEYLAYFKIAADISGDYLEYCKNQLLLAKRGLSANGYDVSNVKTELITPAGRISVTVE